jgi:multidrug efflux pump subunit AcrA (membrane-fusion protein)
VAAGTASAGTLTLAPEAVTEWKPIYGTVGPRSIVPARARIGGVVEQLLVTEGDEVAAGQRIATVRDEKLGF